MDACPTAKDDRLRHGESGHLVGPDMPLSAEVASRGDPVSGEPNGNFNVRHVEPGKNPGLQGDVE